MRLRALERRIPVIGFVGPSGVGKTTLIERLIPELERRGFAVGAVKHASHGFLADRPGKDSHRLYESGASAVALISRDQVATFTRAPRHSDTDVQLACALATLPRNLDVVLAEGFSWEPIPRVLLVPRAEEPRREHLDSGEVLAQILVPASSPGKQPVFSDPLIESLVQAVMDRMARTSRASGADRGDGGASPASRRASS